MARRSASRTVKFSRSVAKRDKMDGRAGRKRPEAEYALRALLGRLRRLELAVAWSISGKPKDFDAAQFVKAVIQLRLDAEIDESRDTD